MGIAQLSWVAGGFQHDSQGSARSQVSAPILSFPRAPSCDLRTRRKEGERRAGLLVHLSHGKTHSGTESVCSAALGTGPWRVWTPLRHRRTPHPRFTGPVSNPGKGPGNWAGGGKPAARPARSGAWVAQWLRLPCAPWGGVRTPAQPDSPQCPANAPRPPQL